MPRNFLGWDEAAYEKLISDFEFMAKLAQGLKKARSFRECLWAARETCSGRCEWLWFTGLPMFAPAQAGRFLQNSLQNLPSV